MPSIIETIHRHFPQFPREFDEMAMEYVMEEYDDDHELAKRVVMGTCTLADARQFAEMTMEHWASHALDAMEHCLSAPVARRWGQEPLVCFFEIRAAYEAFDQAGLI